MKELNLLPNDKVKIIASSSLSYEEQKAITLLYQPLMGIESYTLYMTLWNLINRESLSKESFTHKLLLTLLNTTVNDFENYRNMLEGLSLLDVYYCTEEETYYYLVRNPISAKQFLKDGRMGTYLKNIVGDNCFNYLVDLFSINMIKKSNLINITKTFNEVYNVSDNYSNTSVNSFVRGHINKSRNKSNFDFELYINLLSNNLVNKKSLTKDDIEKIMNIAETYGFNEQSMVSITLDATDANGNIDVSNLRRQANIRYRQMYLKDNKLVETEVIKVDKNDNDESEMERLIRFFRTTEPTLFLSLKNNGQKVMPVDLKLVESLKNDYNLKNEVINVLLDFVLKVNNNSLSRTYCEKIIGEWQRQGIDSAEKAVEYAKKRFNEMNKKQVEKSKSYKSKKNRSNDIELPDWYQSV